MGITKRPILFRAISAIVIVLMTIIMSLSAFAAVRQGEIEHCWQALGTAADSICREIIIRMEDNGSVLNLAAGALTRDSSLGSPEDIVEHVNEYLDMTIFRRIDIVFPDNTILFHDGRTADGKGLVDFDRMVSLGSHISERDIDAQAGDEAIFFNVPVVDGDQAIAVLVGVIECRGLPDYFQPSAFDGQAKCLLVDRTDGSIIMDTIYDEYGNINDFEKIEGLGDYAGVDLMESIANSQSGVIAYNSPRSEDTRYMYYTPVEGYNWQLLVIVEERLAFDHLGPLEQSLGIVVIIEIVVVLISALLNAYSLAQMARSKSNAEHQLVKSNVLIECVTELSSYSDIDLAINNLLSIVNNYFGGDRTYIFDVNYDNQTTSNLYEFAAEGVTKEIDNLQNVPISAISAWLDEFSKSGIFYISDIDRDVSQNSNTYAILAAQSIHSLIAVPLKRGDVIIGYMGVDNPQKNYNDLTLLSSVQFFITEALERKSTHESLTRMSFTDTLTHMHNRNKFNYVCDELLRHPRNRVGVAFFDVDGLKQINDQQGHDAGDRLIINAADNIRSMFSGNSYRIGGDEFAVIVPDIDQNEFDIHVDRVRNMMKKNNISIAIGVSWHDTCSNIKHQLKEADELMYAEKAEHRRQKQAMEQAQ